MGVINMTKTAENKELKQLYEAAKLELQGTHERLIVWAGGDAVNQQDALAGAFIERFPDIPIDIKVDLSKNHDLKINEGLLNGDWTPDVTLLQMSNDFEDWQKMGVLEPFKSVGFTAIRDEFKDPAGDFTVARMFAFLPQYAKTGVAKKPKSLRDLLKPAYKDKLVSTYPHDDDAVLFVFDQMMQQHGIQFLKDFAKQKPLLMRGTALPPLLVGRYEFLGNLTGYETTPDQPSQSFIPKGDFFISWGQRMAMFKLTKHKAAARLFMAFVQSEAYQKTLGIYTVRKDIDLGNSQWIGSYPNTKPLGFYEFMRNRQHIHELRTLMEKHLGPVEGESPVEDHRMIKMTYGWPYF